MTMTLNEIQYLARSEMQEYGLLSEGWAFNWDRAKSRLGACNYGKRRIQLSRPVFEIEANRHKAREVILHEIAHALAGHAAGHGPIWQAIARNIGLDNPTRCSELAQPPQRKYQATCCGKTWYRDRKPASHLRYLCPTCRRQVRF